MSAKNENDIVVRFAAFGCASLVIGAVLVLFGAAARLWGLL